MGEKRKEELAHKGINRVTVLQPWQQENYQEKNKVCKLPEQNH